MKHIIQFDEYIKEAFVSQRSLNQLKRVRDMSKGIDIGDRIDKMQGANLIAIKNPLDSGVETMEDYFNSNKSFRVNQNTIWKN